MSNQIRNAPINGQKTLQRIEDVETIKADKTQVQALETTINNVDTKVNNNQTEITEVKTVVGRMVQQIINLDQRLNDVRTFKYVGNWVNGTAYQKSNAVTYNNNLYVSTVDNNLQYPTNPDFWLHLEDLAPTVDMTLYYTKDQTNTKLLDYVTKTYLNDTKTTTLVVRDGSNGAQNINGDATFTGDLTATNFTTTQTVTANNVKVTHDVNTNQYTPDELVPLAKVERMIREATASASKPPIYLRGQTTFFANKPMFEQALNRLQNLNGGTPQYALWGNNTANPEVICVGGAKLNNQYCNMPGPNGVTDLIAATGDSWTLQQSDLPRVRFPAKVWVKQNSTWQNVGLKAFGANNWNYLGQWLSMNDNSDSYTQIGHCVPTMLWVENISRNNFRGVKEYSRLNTYADDTLDIQLNWNTPTKLTCIPRIAGFLAVTWGEDVYLR